MTQNHDATKAQVRAARPDASTWLAANAGSGKTRVLTDRVARLLLDGVEPQHILCLTYTKAAASEMQNRLFKRLGEWAMREDDALRQSLTDLGTTGEIASDRLRDARTLFARAIETPGGLKIQTIHSFCASLLRRFPLEAGVSPQFTEIEDRAAQLLRAEIIDQMAEGPHADLIKQLAIQSSGQDFDSLTKAVIQHRERFGGSISAEDLLALFGQPRNLTTSDIEGAAFLGNEKEIIDRVVPSMLAKGGNDGTAAAVLGSIGAFDINSLPILEKVFLYGEQAANPFAAKVDRFPTKPTRQALGEAVVPLHAFMQRVDEARGARLALAAAQKSQALHQFAKVFVTEYEAQKLSRGWLDFDDLIDKARQLLSDPAVAAWVLFRIDGGIDHILVDEAQDTSPAQWDVISKLAAEFTSGQGARENVDRTIFVVGDKKQSIYSFQGADPREFDRMQADFKQRIEDAGKLFQSETLRYSFRSSEAVLRVVDHAFDGQSEAGFASDAAHIAFKCALPGRVDLWPLIEAEKDDDDRVWYDPIDRKSATHHNKVLANQIAHQIEEMVKKQETIPDENPNTREAYRRPVRYGDFLILVQRRSDLFAEIIRACKTRELPIAGADRLKVGGELAVRDLAALLSFLAVPDDDLSLASTLKSPLFGWTEQDLFTLAHNRGDKTLWQTLRSQSTQYPETIAMLTDLRDRTDFLRPYDLIERILTRHKGRRNLLARLGAEAEDGINALLTQALAYERTAVPSLTGFLVWMETDDLEIKRQIDSASDQIRVMTVHGAKGLEAPIVILPDCSDRAMQIKDEIITIGGIPVWKTAKDDSPQAMAAALDAIKGRQIEERLRLLYVALTRAEKWLIVAAAGKSTPGGDSWYQMVDAAMTAAGADDVEFQGLAIRRHAHLAWDELPIKAPHDTVKPAVPLESYFRTSAPLPPEQTKMISPSELGGDKALPGDALRSEQHAKDYGTLVHWLIEVFAEASAADWPKIAQNAPMGVCPDSDRDVAFSEAKTVVTSKALEWIFAPGSLAEVPISAPFGTYRLSGKIDRLIVEKDHVWAIDFKTNATVPKQAADCPLGILRQLAAYAHALKQIYPDKHVKLGILWTHSCSFMAVEHEIVTNALRDTPYLDAGTPAS